MEKIQMDTLVSCMKHAEELGFIAQFKATPDGLLSLSTQRVFQPAQLKVIHFYRFEGESNPSDSAIVYAIDAAGEKGTLVDGYGTASESLVSDLMAKVTDMHK
jgi:hypothetical protein